MRIMPEPEPQAVSKRTRSYRELTKKKAVDKEAKKKGTGVFWPGWTLDRPVMRLGGAAAVRAASASSAAHAALARRWLGRKVARLEKVPRPAAPRTTAPTVQQAKAPSTQEPRRPAAPRTTAPTVQQAKAPSAQVPRRPAAPRSWRPTVLLAKPQTSKPRTLQQAEPQGSTTPLVLPSLRTMSSDTALTVKTSLTGSPSDADLRKWLAGAALGRPVLVCDDERPIQRFRLKPTLTHVHDMWFSQRFARRHPQLVKIVKEIAETQGAKWTVRPSAPLRGKQPSSRPVREIGSSADFVGLIHAVMVRG